MSSYSYDDDGTRRYRNVRTRPGGRGEPDYVREETYIERGKGSGPRNGGGELVYRGREDSIEDIPRDFPPPGRSEYGRRSSYRSDYDDYQRSRAGGGGRYSDEYSRADDRYSSYGAGAAGAGAGYAAGRRSGRRDRSRRRDRDDYSDYSESDTRSARSTRTDKKDRRKSEGLLGGLGLGALAGALTGKKDRSRSRSRSRSSERSRRTGRSRSRAASRSSRRRSSSGSRSRSRGGDPKRKTEKKWAQAAQAALIAGAVEAFRSRKEPGAPWTADKGRRIATAAIGAGGIDGLLDRNPNEKTKRHLAEAVVGGLAANRLANGPRSKSRGREVSVSPDGRPRSRSRSIIDRFRGRSQSRPRGETGDGGGNGLRNAALGAGALAGGKALYDRYRSKSRRRSRSRASSADSYVPSRRRNRDKRRSPPSDTGRGDRGLSRGPASRDIDDNGGDGGGGNKNRDLVAAGGAGGGAAALAKADGKKEEEANSSSSTTDMEVKRKRMRGKELLTAGLATVATIHAAHGVYSSMEAHGKRHKLVASGEMSPAEAKKKQTKAWVQDAASVGIAALGIKGAFSEWKEMQEHRYVSPKSFDVPLTGFG